MQEHGRNRERRLCLVSREVSRRGSNIPIRLVGFFVTNTRLGDDGLLRFLSRRISSQDIGVDDIRGNAHPAR